MSTSLAIVPVGPVVDHSVMEHPVTMRVSMPAPVANPQPRPFKFFDTPVLRYIGAKHQIADWITAQMPPHRIYVEPFAGSAAVFMRKHPSDVEILNDLSGDIVNFFPGAALESGRVNLPDHHDALVTRGIRDEL